MIKKVTILGFVLSILISANAIAQGDAIYAAENEGWLVDIEAAYAESQKTGKPILANFTGSDWCGWCKRLTASVFVHDEFKNWAEESVVLLELDFPRRKKLPAKYQRQNQGLQQAFGVRGFPTIWVFDLEKNSETKQFGIKALGKTGYTRTAAEFTANVDKMIARRKPTP